MLGASSLWRGGPDSGPAARPRWYDRYLAPVLSSISSRACTHPIHTIVILAFLASTTYLGLLENTLLTEPWAVDAAGKADFQSLLAGSKRLYVGEDSNWKWIVQDGPQTQTQENAQHLALLTLVFPDSRPITGPVTAPSGDNVLRGNSSIQLLPSSSNLLSPLSYDSTLAFSIPYEQAPEFVSEIQELPAPTAARSPIKSDEQGSVEEKKWIMKAVKVGGDSSSTAEWISNAWTSFVDVLKNAETLDVIIMTLGYLSMHLTFVSLFLSMRRLGSNVWLATSVLFGGLFAFLFAINVTTKLGVHLNMILLSEGLPFLVVTIGFEKPIILTKTVLAAALDARRRDDGTTPSIQQAVRTAVRERGYDIIRDYAIEILILVAGAASGVQGGLRPFCFLAAWILFFDCLLLFTFYTAILTIKLEINRIKRHVALRRALEEDGVSHRVAETVASSNDWPQADAASKPDGEYSVFGRKIRESSVPKFKVLMVSGFVIVNVLNLCTIPFRGARNRVHLPTSSLSSVVTQPPMDPFKVASSGLDLIFEKAQAEKIPTIVTVLAPIKYELQYPSVYYAPQEQNGSFLDNEYADQLLDNVGGRVVEGVLKSLEDPVLSKWIIAALALSLVLNGYLFNAARWTIKDPHPAQSPPKEREVLDNPLPTKKDSLVSSDRSEIQADNTLPIHAPRAPPTPAPEDDETNPSQVIHASEGQDIVKRTPAECERLIKEKRARELTDAELVQCTLEGKIPGYALEKSLGDMTRAVKIRRSVVSRTNATRETSTLLESSKLPYKHFDYERVHGACCENVVGYLPLPLGLAGPLLIDGQNYFLPMATTEGVLVASTSRGCKAINAGGGAVTVLTHDGMTRGPAIGFDSVTRAGAAKLWLDSEEGQKVMKTAFNSTSSFARLQSMKSAIAGTTLYIRFKTTTGDAMGMNMISKGVEKALSVMAQESGFDDMKIISLSANYCTDKKPAAINWIDGRGKGVIAEAVIPGNTVKSVLKTDVDTLVELNINKNLVGSAMAGSIGGFNAHAANILTAIFLATGQDPAQNVESSNCITLMKNVNGNLHISVSMPCIEVGTIGGGTILEPQGAMLDLLGVRGAHPTNPGDNSRQLARIIGAAVLAGELSLCSALAAGHLVQAHMSHNRSAAPSRTTTPAPGATRPTGVQTPTSLAMSSIKDQGLRLTARR